MARNLRCGAVPRIRSASISYRAEFVDDYQGQRTGTNTRYIETGIGWPQVFSPRAEVRPDVSYYKSLDAFALNGNPNLGIPANRNYAIIGWGDIIIHFWRVKDSPRLELGLATAIVRNFSNSLPTRGQPTNV